MPEKNMACVVRPRIPLSRFLAGITDPYLHQPCTPCCSSDLSIGETMTHKLSTHVANQPDLPGEPEPLSPGRTDVSGTTSRALMSSRIVTEQSRSKVLIASTKKRFQISIFITPRWRVSRTRGKSRHVAGSGNRPVGTGMRTADERR